MLVTAVMYPALSVIFFSLLSEMRIYDYTPGYGINVEYLVGIFTEKVALLGLLALLLLAAFGIIQTVYVIKSQDKVRRATMQTYKSIGMPDLRIKRVLKYEYKTAAAHAVIYLIFILAVIIVALNGS